MTIVATTRNRLLTVLLMVATACSTEGTSSDQAMPSAVAADVPCTDASTAAHLGELIDAFNDRVPAPAVVDQYFAPKGDFQWFAFPGRESMEAAADRDSLPSFLEQLRQSGATWRLGSLTQSQLRQADATCNFSLEFEQAIGTATLHLSGKGALEAATSLLTVLSLGVPDDGS